MVLNELSNQPCTFLCCNSLAVYHLAFSLTLLSTSHCIVNRAEKADFFPKPTGNLLPFFSSRKLPQFPTQSIKTMYNLESSEPIYSFILSHVFRDCGTHSSSKSYSCANEILGTEENRKLEPVSSTSRRGARGAYHDEYPRDFGPRIAYTVIPVGPRSGRVGEKYRLLDHMRHIPFIHPAPFS